MQAVPLPSRSTQVTWALLWIGANGARDATALQLLPDWLKASRTPSPCR